MKWLLVMAATAAIGCAGLARAEEEPAPGTQDPRMRYIAYHPGQVVHLSTAVGATLVVTFRPEETVTAVAVTDSKDLSTAPRANYLFFKSKQVLPLQPVIVLTNSSAGARRYVFEIVTTPMADLDVGQPNLYYSVQFTYPEDEAAVRHAQHAARVAARRAREQAAEANFELRQAHVRMEERSRNPSIGPRNWHYVAQGDRSLMPFEVFDNGYSTQFRFPGRVRMPAVFVINPDGKEATANFAVKGDIVQVGSVARGWRLRDGQSVLCIWNQAYDPVGDVTDTGTTSPSVNRVVKDTPP